MSQLEIIIEALNRNGIVGELWVDGSFLTSKIDPNDVDFVLRLKDEVYDELDTNQEDVIRWLDSDLMQSMRCDSYWFAEYEVGHPLYDEGQAILQYWNDLFGHGRDGIPKGIAVVIVGTK